MSVLSDLKKRIENVKNVQGYVIGTLKKKLNEQLHEKNLET